MSEDGPTSGYFERVEGHLLDAVQRNATHPAGSGGSLPARLNALRGWLRARPPALLAFVAVLALSGSAAGAVLLATQHSRGLSGVVPSYDAHGNLSLAGSHYEIELAPALGLGQVGWCNLIVFRDVREPRGHGHFVRERPGAGEFGGGGCGSATPAVGSPLFAMSGSREGLWYVLTAPQVAAVRIAGGPTVLTRADPRLPYGYRAAVAQLPSRAFPPGGPPKLTALDAAGRPIPGGMQEQTAQEPMRVWAAGQRPAHGACSLSPARGSGLTVGDGGVVTAIVPDPGVIGHAFIPCAEVALAEGRRARSTGLPLVGTVLVDARRPGRTLAALPDTRPVPGAPGIWTRAERQTLVRDDSLAMRRVGDAWLLVTGARSSAQAVRVLRALRVGPIELRPARTPASVPRDASCAVAAQPLAGLREVSQTSLVERGGRGLALSRGGPPELALCTRADLYDGLWSLTANVMLHVGRAGMPRALRRGREPVSGAPGFFSVPGEYGAGRELVRRVGGAWLEVSGGSGAAQQLAVARHLRVSLARGQASMRRDLGGGFMVMRGGAALGAL